METTAQSSGDLGTAARRRPSLVKLPWWALVLAAAGLGMVYLILSNTNYQETFDYLVIGVMTTLRMTLIGFPIATVIGLFVGLGRTSKNPFILNLSTLYVETVRGIPLIVIILYFAFGLVPVGIELTNNLGLWGLTWSCCRNKRQS